MKKITLIMFALVASFAFAQNATTAEVVLTQTSGMIGDGGVACGDSGAGTTGDNWYMRSYDLGASGVVGTVQATGIEFEVSTSTGDTPIEVRLYDGAGFPGSFDVNALPPYLASGITMVDPGNVGTMVRVMFDTPAVVDATMTVIAVVYESDGQSAQFYLGTAEDETQTSYLASIACGIDIATPVAGIGFPDAKHVINVIVDDVASVGDNLSELIAVYPNPVSEVLSFKIPSNIEVTNVSMFDMLGKNVGAVYSNGTINTSAFAQGIYTLRVETTSGTLTQKVVKQ